VELILVLPGQGEVIGDSPERRVEILSDSDEVNATWSRFGPGRDGADLHVHRRHSDLFYVLEGTLTVRLGVEDRQVPVAAGTLVRVPPMVVHGFRNASEDEELRYLNLHAPGMRFADYLRAIRDGQTFSYDQEPPPQDGTRPASEAVIGGTGELLADVEEVAVDERQAPGGTAWEAETRRHRRSFYVLEGELALSAGAQELLAPAGSWVQAPPGVEHAVAVAGDAPARFLDIRTPR
jgi:mannose-6-phosphate isomerase-like protein (cupin superfamily)